MKPLRANYICPQCGADMDGYQDIGGNIVFTHVCPEPPASEPNHCYNCSTPIADDAEACAACWVDPTIVPVAADVPLSEAEAAYRAADIVWAGLYRAGGAARGLGDSAWVRELDRMRLAAFAVVEATFDTWQATLARTAA